jgi:hypothetical protein
MTTSPAICINSKRYGGQNTSNFDDMQAVYTVKMGTKTLKRQRYCCKDCGKTFTVVTNTPLYRTHLPDKWLEFIPCLLLWKSLELLDVHYVTATCSQKIAPMINSNYCNLSNKLYPIQ